MSGQAMAPSATAAAAPHPVASPLRELVLPTVLALAATVCCVLLAITGVDLLGVAG